MTANLNRELKELAQKGHLKSFVKSKDLSGGETEYRGRKVVDFTNWDYLSLRSHKKIAAAIHDSLEHTTSSISSPRLLSGTRLAHLSLEERVAKYLSVEAALLFSSRNQAVFSLIASVLNETDIIIVEESTNAPASDAAYLVGAGFQFFSFSTEGWKKRLEDLLVQQKGKSIFIYLDTLSPTTGSLCNIEELCPLCVQYGVKLIIDDAYALGAVGIRGAAFSDVAAIHKNLLFASIGSFGFGIPGFGAYVAGSKDLIGYLVNRSRTFLNEPPPPDFFMPGVEAAIDLIELMTHQRELVVKRSSDLSQHLTQCGFSATPNPAGPVVCTFFSKPSVADDFCSYLLTKNFLVERVTGSTAFNQMCSVRFVINSSHTDLHFDLLYQTLDVAKKISR